MESQLTRRNFLASTSCFGAAIAFAKYLPTPALAEGLTQDSRLASAPIADKGFASIRKIGEGIYATISDPSKGLETLSNGGFIIGKDAVLVVEGFRSAVGVNFQLDTLRGVSRLPILAALDTHYHFDHSMGNAAYGAQGIPIWAHSEVASLIQKNYVPAQTQTLDNLLAPFKKNAAAASNDTDKQHAQGDLNAATGLMQTVLSTVIALPNHPLPPAELPMTVDLGGRKAVIETHPGHTIADIIVRVPEQNIVYTGDLLFSAWYPVTFDASISGWRATLEKFASWEKDTIFVPGHGQVCGQEGIATIRAVFDHLANHAAKMYKAGASADEASHRYTPPEQFKNFPIFAWGFCITPVMAKLYEDYKAGRN